MKGIADTGFLVAFANRGDRHHEWAVQVAEQVTVPLLTCGAVLAETAFHLQDSGLALAMIREGLVTLAFDCRGHSRCSPIDIPTAVPTSPTSASSG